MAYDTVAQGHDSSGTTTSPNEVAIWMYFTSDTIEYTVPTGKIFKGWLLPYNTTTSPDYTFTPSAASIALHSTMGNNGAVFNGTFYHTSTGHDAKWPMMMNAGDKIKRRSSHTWTLMGLETTVNTVSWDTSS
jgi:hypothetical protein